MDSGAPAAGADMDSAAAAASGTAASRYVILHLLHVLGQPTPVSEFFSEICLDPLLYIISVMLV